MDACAPARTPCAEDTTEMGDKWKQWLMNLSLSMRTRLDVDGGRIGSAVTKEPLGTGSGVPAV